jgi:nucleoside-diphosphate-sugar epimerase
MKALVTGATGGLGRNLIERLYRDGHDVIALGRNRLVGKTIASNGIRFEAVDLSENHRLKRLSEGRDVVFHCAALSSPWGLRSDFEAINVQGTINVSDAALLAGARLVHVSTPSIYANFSDQLEINEFSALPKRMVNDYARTKLKAEVAIRSAAREDGLESIILRPRGIFGPYDTTLMPRLMAAAERGPVPLINGGRAVVDVTYVENVVDALILAAEARHIKGGEAFNITNGQGIIISDLIKQALTAVGVPYRTKNLPYWLADLVARGLEFSAWIGATKGEPALTRYTAGLFAFDQTLDINRARVNLGYVPRVSVSEGISRYAEWYRLEKFKGQQR